MFFGWPNEAVLGPEFGWPAREELTGVDRLEYVRCDIFSFIQEGLCRREGAVDGVVRETRLFGRK